ncbi:MAG: class I SAM-dependent methyltransferase [Verrucomicrobia bacterium]|nr:class I SAM-dependent methyltransferase [Verrucomicrobiota bacterium]MBU4428256.1 class I SAM-dependent methyltransferase [Verrucomicrobiota bacterium]MCG2679555.1 class I SAM-dependent methyltransferase [Kiritimatiellia bacterium]
MKHAEFETIKECRSCSSAKLVGILDLGPQPLANALLGSAIEQARRYPLRTAFCLDCGLFQLKDTVRKELLFDSYVWVTGTSLAARDYAKVFFDRTVKRTGLKVGDLVVEIASNDGTILKSFVDAGHSVLGIEPAKNIAKIAEEAGVRTLCAYWNRETAADVVAQHGRARVVMARNVIPHVSELHDVILGISDVLADDGVGIIEFHDGGIIARELHYDSIYHEHLCYFTTRSMTAFLGRFGLYPFHMDVSPISGGSNVIYFSKTQCPVNGSYTEAFAAEDKAGTNTVAGWKDFALRSQEHKTRTIEILREFKGKTVVGFGASARSSTYLNFCGLSTKEIAAIIDNNGLKQERWTAGSNIPIISRDKGLALKPDLVFIIAWNFKDEIMRECRGSGYAGPYLVPFPKTPFLVE